MTVDLAPGLRRSAAGSAAGREWLRGFNSLYAQTMRDWKLRVVPGGPWFGQTAAVFPVLASDGSPAALKLTFPHPEADGEARALKLWDGRGAARLLAERGPFVLLLGPSRPAWPGVSTRCRPWRKNGRTPFRPAGWS